MITLLFSLVVAISFVLIPMGFIAAISTLGDSSLQAEGQSVTGIAAILLGWLMIPGWMVLSASFDITLSSTNWAVSVVGGLVLGTLLGVWVFIANRLRARRSRIMRTQ